MKQTAHKLDDVDLLIVAVLTGIVGLGLGIAGILAFRFSERSRDAADLHSEDDLPEGIAEVLAVLPSAAIVLDAGDDVVKASPAAYTFGLVRGHSLASPEMLRMVERVRSRGLIEEIELEQKREQTDSVLRFLHARVAPLGTNFVLVLCDDQTESKRVDAVRRDFVANVSHELKTPIGAMALLAEAVTDFSDDPQAVERFGGRMQRESKRLTQLVQEIIDLSRVQDHTAPSATEKISAAEVVDDAADRARTRAEGKNIHIEVSPPGRMLIEGNYELLVNAVRNLIDNAINYSPDGTRIGVGVELVDERVEISVTDQGIGLSTQDTERVFERFYRVDPARSRITGGTGLGLSIVKHIIATHGGEVKVWSRLGKGSTFTIVLPLAGTVTDDEASSSAPDGVLLEHSAQAEAGAGSAAGADDVTEHDAHGNRDVDEDAEKDGDNDVDGDKGVSTVENETTQVLKTGSEQRKLKT
ncbi:two-component sensor histidine kinase [Brevibacterium aurantiacum]|uniref:Sensor-like histidine kinase SenX3 n=1 Tax=Brevibacterium aurantiacum TaxID=273384 RepID=A0A2A3Z8E5_BREAU|nr:two-component sensor histidine kinase [Brevibacterium aurantiacum]AZL14909.1 two-component sensor histidine kinase [Brevibacterium aurantiacum]PCC42615.1 two-component sensor histidine kinase [Brevibacterium aurantiacum]PCC47751.1 two-component sensor histidine kinase [Brevibacterium aurantiacum]PCC56844.1 two-component sensor histidine kinase [Brevibacterium aurantiacum]